MPSRKSDTTETSQNESHRSSLRRFSSIASFQALNPFSRRRSTNNDSTIVSSTSTLSLSSSTNATSKPSQKVASSSSSGQFPSDDDLTALPVPPVPGLSTSRRSSYICLPDDPIGGMPRSRTFSNLPLPTRARRNPAMVCLFRHLRSCWLTEVLPAGLQIAFTPPICRHAIDPYPNPTSFDSKA